MPGTGEGKTPPVLEEVLLEARAAGFLGPGPLEPQVRHAEGFAVAGRELEGTPRTARVRVADLGSGGGLPGLVVAVSWPTAEMVLIEANGRRAAFLRRAVGRLGLDDRVSVVGRRAEACGRDPAMRCGFDGVVARSFGRPAVVAECAAPLLKVGGWLVVSEPPGERGGPERWPEDALAELGLEPAGVFVAGYGYQMLRQRQACPDRYPRRDGVPAKQPLF